MLKHKDVFYATLNQLNTYLADKVVFGKVVVSYRTPTSDAIGDPSSRLKYPFKLKQKKLSIYSQQTRSLGKSDRVWGFSMVEKNIRLQIYRVPVK